MVRARLEDQREATPGLLPPKGVLGRAVLGEERKSGCSTLLHWNTYASLLWGQVLEVFLIADLQLAHVGQVWV